MNLLRVVSVAAFAAAAAIAACSTPIPIKPICNDGDNVVCACADGRQGTKLCNSDGTGYATGCRINATTSCEDESDAAPALEQDTCPGTAIAITRDEKTIQGDTSSAEDNYTGGGVCAGGASAPDHVYTLVASETGKVDIELTPAAGYDAMMYIGTGECAPKSMADYRCVNAATAGTREITTVGMIAGTKYYLVIDGAAGPSQKGQYALSFKLTPGPFCGDGEVAPGEACDDGNTVGDDGCASTCKNVDGNPPAGVACPGQPVHLWKTSVGGAPTLARVSGTGTTDEVKYPSVNNQWTAPGSSCTVGMNAANDRVYAVTPHDSGTLTVTATPNFNAMILVRSACDDSTKLTQCANSKGTTDASQVETVSLPVVKDATYFVAVDGAVDASGDYSVAFELK